MKIIVKPNQKSGRRIIISTIKTMNLTEDLRKGKFLVELNDRLILDSKLRKYKISKYLSILILIIGIIFFFYLFMIAIILTIILLIVGVIPLMIYESRSTEIIPNHKGRKKVVAKWILKLNRTDQSFGLIEFPDTGISTEIIVHPIGSNRFLEFSLNGIHYTADYNYQSISANQYTEFLKNSIFSNKQRDKLRLTLKENYISELGQKIRFKNQKNDTAFIANYKTEGYSYSLNIQILRQQTLTDEHLYLLGYGILTIISNQLKYFEEMSGGGSG